MYETRGHSCLPCDRDFGRLALLKKKQDTVYTAEEWIEIFRSDTSENTTYVDVSQNMLNDYKTYFSKIKDPKPVNLNEKTTKWTVTKYKIIEYSGTIVTTTTTASNVLTKVFGFKKTELPKSGPSDAYTQELPLKVPKARDIKKYIDSIPVQFKKQYEELINKYGNLPSENLESGSELWDTDSD